MNGEIDAASGTGPHVVTRKELYDRIWRTSASRLAPEFGIPGRGLGKLGTAHDNTVDESFFNLLKRERKRRRTYRTRTDAW